MKNYKRELEFAKNLAYQAGKIMRSYVVTAATAYKDNNSPVSQADLAISRLVNVEIAKNFPNHAVIDEENKYTIPNNEFIWVCDPLDGTIPYSLQIPTSIFSLALCHRQKPVVAVCYDPYSDRCYHSAENQPAYLNNHKISVSNQSFSKGANILAIPFWFNYFLKTREFDANYLFKTLHEMHLVLTYVESCVYSSMLVASGSVLAAILPGAYPWDRAAAKLLVENAGGMFTDETGSELTVFGEHGMQIVTNKTVHIGIMQIVKKCILS